MKRKGLFLFLCFTILVFAFWLGVWTSWTEARAHYTPEYAKRDITSVLKQETLSEGDYDLLFRQTGMARTGVDALRAEGREWELLYLQERFFEEVEVECLRSNLIVQSERLVEDGWRSDASTEVPPTGSEPSTGSVLPTGSADKRGVELSTGVLPTLQDGDILISFAGHIFGWRYGHAAIVVDAERSLTVEAINMGSDSALRSVEHWKEYPSFALVRATGIPAERREAAAEYAEKNLVGVPYSLLSFGGKQGAVLSGTHCAHLVWYAYAQLGYDLDSDGGVIVTPRDIYESDMVEVIQIYGLAPD